MTADGYNATGEVVESVCGTHRDSLLASFDVLDHTASKGQDNRHARDLISSPLPLPLTTADVVIVVW